MNLDHDTFHALEIDALYDELDGPRAAEIHAHAASCESCSSRFERLRRARRRGLAALAEPVSHGFESRVMAAVDAALAGRAGGPALLPRPQHLHIVASPPAAANVAAATGAGAGGAGAKVIPFFSRPSFAVAATLVLVLGAAAILGQLSMATKSASMASAAAPAEAASGFTPVPVSDEPLAAAQQTATATALATAAVPPTVVAAGEAPADDGEGLSLAERARSGGAAAPRPAARKPAAVAMNDPAPPPPMAAPSPAKSKPIGGASDGSLSAAKALYGAGRYSEACPTFEALRASSPEADLYAARCVLRVNGCSAAVPRLDGVASRHAGTDVGNRARADSEACTRAQASKNATPNAAATTGPGTPSGGGAAGRPSAPKAPAQEFDSK